MSQASKIEGKHFWRTVEQAGRWVSICENCGSRVSEAQEAQYRGDCISGLLETVEKAKG